jgi:large subunit ribosomal protein L25
MKTLSLSGQKREALGKKESKKLRNGENVPAVLYGGEQPIHFSVPFSELRELVYTPDLHLVNIDIEGTVCKAILQDIQWHPVEEQALHIDFLKVEEDKPIKVALPVKLLGLAKGTKIGGKLKSNMRKLKVKALYKNIPDVFEIDITELDLGQSIKVGDLQKENLILLDPKSNVVVTVAATRASRAAETGGK